jgi:hypothetical protein
VLMAKCNTTQVGCFDYCLTSMHSLIKQIPKRPPSAPRLRIYHRQSPRWYRQQPHLTYIATGSAKAAQSAGLSAALFTGIGGLRGGKMGANGKMQCISSSIANHLRHIL